MTRGKYILFEGDEGAGKTTQLDLAQRRLAETGITAEIVREPGGDPIAEELREIVKHTRHPLDPLAEVYLFCAARANVLANVVRPKLDAGEWVLSDRGFPSTLVYQGMARGLNNPELYADALPGHEQDVDFARMVHMANARAVPDLIFILNVPLEVSLGRVRRRGERADRFEAESLEFREKVNNGYWWLSRFGEYTAIEADATVEVVHESIWLGIQQLLGQG